MHLHHTTQHAPDPRKSTGATLAPYASAGVVVGVCARPVGSQAVCVT
jgi:hypothetical protein